MRQPQALWSPAMRQTHPVRRTHTNQMTGSVHHWKVLLRLCQECAPAHDHVCVSAHDHMYKAADRGWNGGAVQSIASHMASYMASHMAFCKGEEGAAQFIASHIQCQQGSGQPARCCSGTAPSVRVWSWQWEVAIANQCQPRGTKRVGVQVPRSFKVVGRCQSGIHHRSWSDPFSQVYQTVTLGF